MWENRGAKPSPKRSTLAIRLCSPLRSCEGFRRSTREPQRSQWTGRGRGRGIRYALQYVPLPSVTESRDMGSFHPTPVEQLRCSPQSCITHCIHPPHIMSPARSEAKGCVRWLQLPVRNPGSRDRTNICQMTAKKDKTLEAGGRVEAPRLLGLVDSVQMDKVETR